MLQYLPKISNTDSMISHPNTLLCNTFIGFISLMYYTNLTETAKMRYTFGCDVGVTGRKLGEERAKVHPTLTILVTFVDKLKIFYLSFTRLIFV